MIEEVISLKDLVTGPAIEMLEGVTKLKKGVEELKHGLQHMNPKKIAEGLKGISSGVGMIVTPLAEAAEHVIEFGKELLETAIEATEFKEQMLAAFSALSGGEEAGQATLDMVNDLSREIPQSRKEIADWTKQFMAMGITDLGALREQITATASASALFGKEGADAYVRLTTKIKDAAESHQKLAISARQLIPIGGLSGKVVAGAAAKMNISVAQLAAQMKAGTLDAAKFGDALQGAMTDVGKGPLEQMMGSLPTQIAKGKELIMQLFEMPPGVIEPLSEAVKSFFTIFDMAQPSGKAMKAGLVAVLTKVFQIMAKGVMMVKHLTLDLIILGLKGYIALKPVINAFKWLVSGTEGANATLAALAGGGIALLAIGLWALIPPMWALVTSLAAAAVASFVAALPFLLIVAGVALLALGIYELVKHWDDVVAFFKDMGDAIMDWAMSGVEAAENFVNGLIDGITGGIGRAVQAVKDMGSAVKDGIASFFNMHSPSRVMMDMGLDVTGGFAEGITGGTRKVAGAATDVSIAANDNMIPSGAYSSAASKSGAATPPASSSSSLVVNVEPGAIVIQGGGRGAVELTEEAVSLIFERVAASQGAA